MTAVQNDAMASLARSVDLLLKLKLAELRGNRSQKEMILMLGEMGASANEIASLLGISKTTAAPELSKARGEKKTTRARRRGR